MTTMRHGGRILVDQLAINGCKTVFCVPGESYLAALDGLYDQSGMRTVVCRQEGGAAMMAEAYGKLTGRPGVCFVTRGPGATNASAGIHIAQQDSTPMILFIGQIARDFVDREAFQEVDFKQMFRPLAKWAAQIDSTVRIPEYVSRAYHTAMSGRPGPVVLALPEDMLADSHSVEDARAASPVRASADDADMQAVGTALAASERPIVIVGGGTWCVETAAAVTEFAERWSLPVVAEFRCQDYIDNRHPCYVGDLGLDINPRLFERIAASDLILSIGARLGEMPTQRYSLLTIPNPTPHLIHVHPGAEELGRVYRPELAIQASVRSFAGKLDQISMTAPRAWSAWTQAARADYLAHIKPLPSSAALDVPVLIHWLSGRLPSDAMVTNGAGLYTATVQRYYQYRAYRTQLAPVAGSMGYGLPAAISAKLMQPEKTVVCVAGDGCFLMTGQELATAVQYDAAVIIIIVNNGMYGTIRMHQERAYPGRVIATTLRNPDFATYAQSFGADGQLVTTTGAFAGAFERALQHSGPALIELRLR